MSPLADTLGVANPLRYRGYYYDAELEMYYLQSRYYDPDVRRFINGDSCASTGQGLVGNNMFAYCLNSPVMGIDFCGDRAYFVNGINNGEDSDSPEYAKDFSQKLEELGVNDVIPIPVYNGQTGLWGTICGSFQVICEMLNIDIYTSKIVAAIEADLMANPLAEGETITLIGYSGGGQLALNVMEAMEGQIDNVILIGTPIAETWYSTTKVHMIYSKSDILSWNVGYGYTQYCVGAVGHTSYFSEENIDSLANHVYEMIKQEVQP